MTWNWIGEEVALAAHDALMAEFAGPSGVRDRGAQLAGSAKTVWPDGSATTWRRCHNAQFRPRGPAFWSAFQPPDTPPDTPLGQPPHSS